MPDEISFRSYSTGDKDACLALFDANCPTFFAPNERPDYETFLAGQPDRYEVCEAGGLVVGAFGLQATGEARHDLCWIMLDPGSQGMGIGSAIMKRVISTCRSLESAAIGIAASHLSAPFFSRFGAVAIERTEDGWGPGMHRIDMELAV